MQLGLIGLGGMGGAVVRRLMNGGHDLVIFNRSAEKMKSFVESGAVGTSDLRELVGKLEKPRVVWIMLPAGHSLWINEGLRFGESDTHPEVCAAGAEESPDGFLQLMALLDSELNDKISDVI